MYVGASWLELVPVGATRRLRSAASWQELAYVGVRWFLAGTVSGTVATGASQPEWAARRVLRSRVGLMVVLNPWSIPVKSDGRDSPFGCCLAKMEETGDVVEQSNPSEQQVEAVATEVELALPSLDEDSRDRAVAITRAIAGAMPLAGGAVSELVTSVIPGQRVERIVRFLRVLDARLAEIEKDIRNRLHTEEFADIFEDGVWQASRAITDERRQYIANFLANSLTREELDRNRLRRLLGLLDSLSDPEVIILKYLSRPRQTIAEAERDPFRKHHAKILYASMLTWGDLEKDPEDSERKMDDDAFLEQSLRHLQSHGLIRLPSRYEEDRLKSWLKDALKDQLATLRSPHVDDYEATRLGCSLISWIESDDLSVGDTNPGAETDS